MLNFNAHFIPLLTALEVKDYPHTVEVSNDGLCIRFEDGSDIALNSYTYGHDRGELEGYKGVFATPYDDVSGYLTAYEVLCKLGLE